MTDEGRRTDEPARLDRNVAGQERRKLRAREQQGNPLWVGFASFGLVGWSIALPTVAGVAIGVWLDRRYPGRYSWTLMLLGVGIVVGCINAWHWVSREHRAIRRENEEHKND